MTTRLLTLHETRLARSHCNAASSARATLRCLPSAHSSTSVARCSRSAITAPAQDPLVRVLGAGPAAIHDGTPSLSATATLWRATIRFSIDPFGTSSRPLPKPDGAETDMIHNAQHVQRTRTPSVVDWCLHDWLLTVVVPPTPPWVARNNRPHAHQSPLNQRQLILTQYLIRCGSEAPRSYRLYMTHTPASVRD